MSLATFIQTVETDAETIWGEAVGDIEAGAIALWNLVKPVLSEVEADAATGLQAFIAGIVKDPANIGADLATLETTVLNALEAAGSALFNPAKALGSNLLQVLIGLVLHSL